MPVSSSTPHLRDVEQVGKHIFPFPMDTFHRVQLVTNHDVGLNQSLFEYSLQVCHEKGLDEKILYSF